MLSLEVVRIDPEYCPMPGRARMPEAHYGLPGAPACCSTPAGTRLHQDTNHRLHRDRHTWYRQEHLPALAAHEGAWNGTGAAFLADRHTVPLTLQVQHHFARAHTFSAHPRSQAAHLATEHQTRRSEEHTSELQ